MEGTSGQRRKAKDDSTGPRHLERVRLDQKTRVTASHEEKCPHGGEWIMQERGAVDRPSRGGERIRDNWKASTTVSESEMEGKGGHSRDAPATVTRTGLLL